MNRNDSPKPPDDLLARCLATIPETATLKPVAPRLSPDAGSRRRLTWLVAAATVPVVTVLAILPAKIWSENRGIEQPRAESGMKVRAVSYCSALTVRREPNAVATRPEDWYTDHVIVIQQVWHKDKGRHTSGGRVEGDKNMLAGKFLWSSDVALELPDGTVYQRLANAVRTGKKTPAYFRQIIDGVVRNLFDPERCTELMTGYGHYEKPSSRARKHPPVIVEKRVPGDFWGTKGQPRKVEVVVCVQRPCEDLSKRGAPTIRVRYYRDLKTGLCYAYEAFAVWESGKRKGQAPLLIGRTTYQYEPRQYSMDLLNPENLGQNR